MFKQNDILQQKLRELENGTPLEQILMDLPVNELELIELIRLAAQVSAMPHPKPLLARKHALKFSLLQNITFARSPGKNGNGHHDIKITKPQPTQKDQSERSRRLLPLVNLRLASAAPIFSLFLALGLVVALLGVGIFWLATPARAHTARLEDVTGTIAVADTKFDNNWQLLAEGDNLRGGQRLRTTAGSSATLVFYDGSRAHIGSGADITLNRVDGNRGGVLHVVMTQNEGKSSHQVVPFQSDRSTYLVFTPSGTVSVHGTRFSVNVGDTGKTRFAVDSGKVLVANQASQAYLTAGQTLSALPEESLDEPDYQFSLQGLLTSSEGTTWIVAGVAFEINAETIFVGNPEQNDTVLVEGYIDQDGTWVADSVAVLEEGAEIRTFSGILNDMDGEEWQVGDHTFMVDDQTDVEDGLILGDIVQVTFMPSPDSGWLALSVDLLEDETEEPTPTPTPDPDADPVLEFDPAQLQVPVCTGDAGFDAALINNGLDPDDNAVDVILDHAILNNGEYVDSISLDPTMWALIAAGESQDFAGEIELAEIWETVAEGTFVGLRIFVASEANTPEGHPDYLNIILVKSCEDVEPPTPTATITDTLTVSETATITPTATLTVTLTPGPIESVITDCTGADPQPKGARLAEEYGVPYEEIMAWFCQNYGFGEIDQAYELSLQYGIPVADIFDMRAAGMGWGNIKKALKKEPLPTPTPTPADSSPEIPETGDEDDQGDGDVCTSKKAQHVPSMNLAGKYGVSYDEIIGWYCQGYNTGDINQAYSLSQQYNVPASDIFAMRASGMHWGQIKKSLKD